MKTSLIACVILMGCGGGSGGDVAVTDLGAEIGESTCSRMFECCDAEEIMDQLGFFNITDEEGCVGFYTGFVGGFLTPQVQASVAAGRMVYHGDRMATCLDLLSSMSCADFGVALSQDTPWGGCEDPFEGLVANGSDCSEDMECVSDYCEGEETDEDGNVTADGVCLALPTTGNDCPDSDCATGAYCSFQGADSVCVATVAAGEDCDSDQECSSDNCEGADPQNSIVGSCASTVKCNGQ